MRLHLRLPCPDCLASMTRGLLTTQHRAADVERCVPCNRLLLEPGDQAAQTATADSEPDR